MLNEWTSKGMVNSAKQGTQVNGRPYSIVCTGTNCYMYFINIDCDLFKHSRVKANITTLSSDIHQLQLINLHHFKLERLKNQSSDFTGN